MYSPATNFWLSAAALAEGVRRAGERRALAHADGEQRVVARLPQPQQQREHLHLVRRDRARRDVRVEHRLRPGLERGVEAALALAERDAHGGEDLRRQLNDLAPVGVQHVLGALQQHRREHDAQRCIAAAESASPREYGCSITRRHQPRSDHGSCRRKRSREYMSLSAFCIGVPLTAQRRVAARSQHARATSVAGFLIVCASSRIITTSHRRARRSRRPRRSS